MTENLKTARTMLSLLIGGIGAPLMAWAAPLPLVQYPAGTANRAPAPNVILTLDDSGSMGSGQYSSQGMFALKDALQKTFSVAEQNVPNGTIRLAWNTFNKCRAIPANTTTVGCSPLRVLDDAHRTRFLSWVGEAKHGTAPTADQLMGNGNTPTHAAYKNAGDYILNAVHDYSGPWAAVPGTTLEPVLSCRRTYNILMTDGEWNITPPTTGNYDSAQTTLPDGKVYEVTGAVGDQTRLYRNPVGSTLADLSFLYWSTDLAPTLTNNVAKLTRQTGDQTFTAGVGSQLLEEYWNPKNNPATWQGITTYTIGFNTAASWSGAPKWDTQNNDSYGGDFARLATGQVSWPNPNNSTDAKKMELWQMALAGRGRFIPAESSAALVSAFRDIFGEIAADSSTPVTGFANSSTSVNRSPVAQYAAGYVADGWKGYVRADTLAQGSGAATPYADWGATQRTTADKLDALTDAGITDRLILTYRDMATGGGGTLFEWAANEAYLSTAQKTLLKAGATGTAADMDTLGEQRLNYLRGDRRLESTDTVVAQFRKRGSRQGDIVNSTLWYVAQPVSGYSFDGYLAFATAHRARLPMVYVGGNDGMLHGFSGADGNEKIAYVPKGVIQNLPALTLADYQHQYYVDGSPFSGDVNWKTSDGNNWRTLLVGTLGAGGKGYFVLDVTTPGSTAAGRSAEASNFLKANASDLVVMDRTAHPSVAVAATTDEADIGHITVAPVLDDDNPQKSAQITRMNNGRWAYVTGNGYNSTNERPVLLIQYLDGDKALLRIPAAITGANATGNGLSAPRLVDINGDGTPDVVYAGDLKGNLWKFNVASATPSEWDVAGWGANLTKGPLYTAVYTSGNASAVQPITAAPLVRANERGAGGLMVAFGTGRNLTEGDRTDIAVQSVYSVLDNTRYKLSSSRKVVLDMDVTPVSVGTGVSSLVQQTVSSTKIAGSGNSAARDFWTVSENVVTYTGTGAKKGWYLNLPATGERLLAQMRFYDQSNLIELITEAPASGGNVVGESCQPPRTAPQNFRTFLNINDGKRPSVQILDLNGDGAYNLGSDQGVSRMTASNREGRVTTKSKTIITGADGKVDLLGRLPELPLRPSWRQLR